jgi:hypothetical protein
MGYYLREYQEGHISLEPLTMALFELFNTRAKVTHPILYIVYYWALVESSVLYRA